ncbi:porin [Tateyamaria sp.]|uniref:porin n=1 Tax=Tateyamaria sp. TaxID=1929288 RepID=UPI00329EB706
MQNRTLNGGLPRVLLLSLCILAGQEVHANDREVSLGGNTTLMWYGQLHFANQSFDDGAETTSTFVDVSSSNSRFGFYLRGQSPVSFQFETGLGFRPSTKTSQTNTPDFWNWSKKDLRQVQLIYEGSVGTFRFGQGSMSNDGVAELDLAETAIVAKSNLKELYGSYLFRDRTGALTTVDIGSTFDNFDNGRRFRVRYDSNAISGFSFAAAYGVEVLTSGVDDRFYDFALNYANRFNHLEIEATLGTAYTDLSAGGDLRETVGSMSIFDHRTGLNATLAMGKDQSGGGQYLWSKLGWNADLIAVGTTKLAVEGFWGSDYETSGSRSRMWGVSVVQDFDQQRIEAYAGYKRFSYDDAGPAAYMDADAWQIGARWRF